MNLFKLIRDKITNWGIKPEDIPQESISIVHVEVVKEEIISRRTPKRRMEKIKDKDDERE